MTDRERIAEDEIISSLEDILVQWDVDCPSDNAKILLSIVKKHGYTRQPEPSKHKLIKSTDLHPQWHREGHCPICDGGLGICSICGKAESALDLPCQPEPPPDRVEAVASELFFQDWDEESGYAMSNASNGNWAEQTDEIFREHYYKRARSILSLFPEPVLTKRAKIVCLCGSTRFKQQFIDANFQETTKGNIVLSVGWFSHSNGNIYTPTPEEKIALDELHKQKIDLADEVLILNVGGYIGESTRSEIEYATNKGKVIRYLEPAHDQDTLNKEAGK